MVETPLARHKGYKFKMKQCEIHVAKHRTCTHQGSALHLKDMNKWLEKLNPKAGAPSKPREYLYPTKKNVLLLFLLMQPLPILLVFLELTSTPVPFLLKFEGLILGALCVWPRKPEELMSKRDKFLELKWTNRMFAYSLPCLVFPALVLMLDESASSWTALNSFAIPMFSIVSLMSAMTKIQQGGFFAAQPKLPSAPVVKVESPEEQT